MGYGPFLNQTRVDLIQRCRAGRATARNVVDDDDHHHLEPSQVAPAKNDILMDEAFIFVGSQRRSSRARIVATLSLNF